MVYSGCPMKPVTHKPGYAGCRALIFRATVLSTLVLPLSLPSAPPAAGAAQDPSNGVFGQLTRHIQAQITTDKIAFAQASGCANWFYRQEKQKPAPLEVHPIRRELILEQPSREECLRLYPGGLDAVRQDFHRTQSSLSVSLTSYEFALVVDGDDDARYSRDELSDLFQSLALAYDPAHSSATQAATLTERFDAWYKSRNLENVMNGMSRLYEKGYRVTAADRAELDRVTR